MRRGASPRLAFLAAGLLAAAADGLQGLEGGALCDVPEDEQGTMLLQRGVHGIQSSSHRIAAVAPDAEVRYVDQQCASDTDLQPLDCPECLMDRVCRCNGEVRFGYGRVWTAWVPVAGSVECSSATFGDPYPGHSKICICSTKVNVHPVGQPAAPAGRDAVAASTGHKLLGPASLWTLTALTVTYFSVHGALALVRHWNQAQQSPPDLAERVLEATSTAVGFAPMLSAFILAVDKRADLLAAGHPSSFGLPPQYIRGAVAVCAVAFVLQTVLYAGREWHSLGDAVDAQQGRAAGSRNVGRSAPKAQAAKVLGVLGCVTLLFVYAPLFVVILGTFRMNEPSEVHMVYGTLPSSTGTFCCTCLAVLYFFVYGMIHVSKCCELLRRGREAEAQQPQSGRLVLEALTLASSTLNFVPMLSILLLGAQMTADSQHAKLPDHVETSMYLCSFMVILQVVLALLAPFATNSELEVPAFGSEVNFVAKSHDAFLLVSICRWMAMTAQYSGVALICAFLWSLPLLPVWSRLVTDLAGYFFMVYVLIWAVLSLRQLRGGGFTTAIRTLTAAKDTVSSCPMIAMLVLESWVRASRLATAQGLPGAPPGYAQDAMSVAVFALFIQVLTVSLHSLACGKFRQPQLGERPGGLAQLGLGALAAILILARAAMYGGVAVAIAALFASSIGSAGAEGLWLA